MTTFLAIDQVRARLVPAAVRTITARINAERADLLAQSAGSTEALVFDPDAWAATLFRVWMGAGESFYATTVDDILAMFKGDELFHVKQLDPAQLRQLRNNPGALNAIAERVRRVGLQEAQSGSRLLQRNADMFDSTEQAIRALYQPGEVRSRAQRIAENNVLDATAEVQQAAAVATERALLKSWLSRGDAKVRPTHGEAHAVYSPGGDPGPIGLEEAFNVGSGTGQHPRAASLPARERINCRCQTRYIPAARVTS